MTDNSERIPRLEPIFRWMLILSYGDPEDMHSIYSWLALHQAGHESRSGNGGACDRTIRTRLCQRSSIAIQSVSVRSASRGWTEVDWTTRIKARTCRDGGSADTSTTVQSSVASAYGRPSPRFAVFFGHEALEMQCRLTRTAFPKCARLLSIELSARNSAMTSRKSSFFAETDNPRSVHGSSSSPLTI